MSLLRRLHDEERGFTLADLMIGALIMMILTGAALSMLDATYRTVGHTSRETRSLDQARLALAQLDHEIRVAASIADATADCPSDTCLLLAVPLPGGTITDVRYIYSAADHVLYRTTGNALLGSWSAQSPVVTDVHNTVSLPVFCRAPSSCTTPSEKSIAIVLDVNTMPSKASETVRLSSYATPRNLG